MLLQQTRLAYAFFLERWIRTFNFPHKSYGKIPKKKPCTCVVFHPLLQKCCDFCNFTYSSAKKRFNPFLPKFIGSQTASFTLVGLWRDGKLNKNQISHIIIGLAFYIAGLILRHCLKSTSHLGIVFYYVFWVTELECLNPLFPGLYYTPTGTYGKSFTVKLSTPVPHCLCLIVEFVCWRGNARNPQTKQIKSKVRWECVIFQDVCRCLW